MTAHPDHRDAYDTWRGRVITAQNETRAANREIEDWQRRADAYLADLKVREATLRRIDQLHTPDPDHPTACQCGVTHPCKTRRELDR